MEEYDKNYKFWKIMVTFAIFLTIIIIVLNNPTIASNDSYGSVQIVEGVNTFIIPSNSFSIQSGSSNSYVTFSADDSSSSKNMNAEINTSLLINADKVVIPGYLKTIGSIEAISLSDGIATLSNGSFTGLTGFSSESISLSGDISYDSKSFKIQTTLIDSKSLVKSYPTKNSIIPVDEAYEGNAIIHEDLNDIYFPPHAQGPESVWHKIKATNGRVLQYTSGINADLNAYSGGAYHTDLKRLYFCPFAQLSSTNNICHYIDEKGEAKTYAITPIVSTTAYRGAAYVPELKRIIFAPFGNADQAEWHYIDSSGLMQTYTHNATGVLSNAYWGAAYVENATLGSRVYFTPYAQSDQLEWHYYDVNTESIVAYTVPTFESGEQPQSEAYRGDGIIVQTDSVNTIYFAPSTNTVINSFYYKYINITTGIVGEYIVEQKIHDIIISAISGSYAPNSNRVYFGTKKKSLEGEWFYLNVSDNSISGYSAPDEKYIDDSEDVHYSGSVYEPILSRVYMTPHNFADLNDMENWYYINDNFEAFSVDKGEISFHNNQVKMDQLSVNQDVSANSISVKNSLIISNGFTNFLKLPELTTIERDSITVAHGLGNGVIIFNSDLLETQVYIGSSWVNMH
jgi:hypothetical protein